MTSKEEKTNELFIAQAVRYNTSFPLPEDQLENLLKLDFKNVRFEYLIGLFSFICKSINQYWLTPTRFWMIGVERPIGEIDELTYDMVTEELRELRKFIPNGFIDGIFRE